MRGISTALGAYHTTSPEESMPDCMWVDAVFPTSVQRYRSGLMLIGWKTSK
ncbi:hypothetical protein LEMLEM_LOCUS2005 [Lemmus lemmus]